MSEVYIRSQNKEKLYRLGGNYACVEYGEYEDVKKKRGGAVKTLARLFFYHKKRMRTERSIEHGETKV